MSIEIELEKTYLAKYLPSNLDQLAKKEIVDIYIPKDSYNANLRIRKIGNSFSITKKTAVNEHSRSTHKEETIYLTKEEFLALSKISGNIIYKTRYYYKYLDYLAEIDVFWGKHYGLVLIDFEFKNVHDLKNFITPNFCLADLTEEDAIAGGILSYKTIEDISNDLKKYGYQKIFYKKNKNL